MKKPQIKNMSLRDKIAQTLLVRQSDLMLRSDKDYAERRSNEEIIEILEKNQFGGIWIHGNLDVNQIEGSLDNSFSFTTETYQKWLRAAKKSFKIPVICANDMAGKASFTDLSQAYSGLLVGAADSEKLSYQMGRTLAREHALAGCNWIWYPMVDLVSPFTTSIGRPFAGDPDLLIKCSTEFIRGMQGVNIASTAKHFPGADPRETRDPHIINTTVGNSLEEWKANQGRVFQALINAGVYTVMTSASAFPAVDCEKRGGRYLPCSLSYKIVTRLLKEDMGFEGVVITDDVTMGGYTSFYGHDNLYVELLKAGNDVLLGVGIDAIDIVERGVKDGRISEERINDACRRVLDLKEKVGLFEEDIKEPNYTVEEAKAETAEVAKAIAEKGITLIRDENLIPISKEKVKKVTILTYSHAKATLSQLEVMKQEFEKRGAKVVLRNKLESFTDSQKVADESDLIVYAGFIGHHAPKGLPSFYDDVFWSLRYAFNEGREKSVGVSLGYPFIHYDFMEDAPTFVNLYSPIPATQKAFVAALYGEIPFKGIAPLDMNRRR